MVNKNIIIIRKKLDKLDDSLLNIINHPMIIVRNTNIRQINNP